MLLSGHCLKISVELLSILKQQSVWVVFKIYQNCEWFFFFPYKKYFWEPRLLAYQVVHAAVSDATERQGRSAAVVLPGAKTIKTKPLFDLECT